MKLATSRDNNAKHQNPQSQSTESEGPSKVMSPPPFDLGASPVQAKGLPTGDGPALEGGDQEQENDHAGKGSGSIQLKQAGGDTPPVQRKEEEEEATQLKSAAPVQRQLPPIPEERSVNYDVNGQEQQQQVQQSGGLPTIPEERAVNHDINGNEQQVQQSGGLPTIPEEQAVNHDVDGNLTPEEQEYQDAGDQMLDGMQVEQVGDQEVNVTIPGAFDITQGPDKFHQYIMAAVGNIFTSNTFSVNLFFNINLGIKADVLNGMFGIGGGGVFGVSCTLNRQDDRLVRGGWAIKYGGQFVSDILWFIHYTREWVGKSSRTAVYRDMPHFAAACFDTIKNGYNKIAEHSKGKLKQFEYGEYDGEGYNWEGLANRPTTKVHGHESSVSNNLELSVKGVNSKASGSWGESNSTSHFYKEQGDHTITKTSTQKVKDYSLAAEVDGVGIELGLAYTDIANHANADNDGSYKNMSITFNNFPQMAKLKAGLAKDIQTVTSALAGTADPMVTLQLAAGMIAGFVKKQISSMSAFEMSSWTKMKAGAAGKSETGTSTSFTAELNFIKSGSENEWALQYFRLSAGAGAQVSWDASVPVASLYGVASIDAYTNGNAGANASAGLIEILGSNTISYLITVYNGLVYTEDEVNQGFAKDRFSRWKNYRTTHMPAIKQMIKALGNQDSIPFQEATGSYGLDASDPLVAAAAEAAETGNVSGTAVQLFENFLYRNYVNHKADGTATAGDEGAMEQGMKDGAGRTPWYQSVGGTSKIFIDQANQGSPILKRSQYNPKRQAPTRPTSIMDSLYQEQKLDFEWVLKRRETGGMFTSGGADILRNREFTIPKGTDRAGAAEKLAKNFKKELDEPGKFNVALLNGAFANTNLPQLWNIYYQAKAQPTGNRAQNRRRSQDIAAKKATFISQIDPALEQMSQQVLGLQIQEAGNDVQVDEGWFFDDDVLVVN